MISEDLTTSVPAAYPLAAARLLLLVPVLDFGGVETRIAIQVEHMRDRVRELRVCSFWKAGVTAERLRAMGVPVDILGVNPSIRNPRATIALARYLRAQRPDIVHGRIGEVNWHVALAGRLSRVPVRIIEEVGIPTRSALARNAFPWVYRLAHRVVGVSQATCDFLIHRDRVPAEKVRLVYNAADRAFFEPVRRKEHPEGAPFRILSVGRLAPVKNQAMLLRAFAALHREHPNSELLLVGEGPSRGELESIVAALGLERSVRLLGFRRDIREQLATADLFVLPSHSEGFGIALVEAMACEVPVLASKVGGAAEVMDALDPAFLLSPEDEAAWTAGMSRMLAMPRNERIALARRCRELVFGRFSPEAYVAALEDLYAEALGERMR
jgi:glycosyltransferase involved in cell wall biosynthesis